MKYYKDLDNKIHVLESNDFKHLLPASCVEITKADANNLSPKPTIDDKRNSASIDAVSARMALKSIGKLKAVKAKMKLLADDDDVLIYWESSSVFHRTHPLLIQFCTVELGMTDLQIDALFGIV